MANVGPGLGPIIGPAGTFGPLPDAAKWALALAMIVGRLEVVTVLVLLSPTFWRS
jgi:trk system potassium uptake protein TrkH